MGHKVSRHKTYMVSRIPDTSPTRIYSPQANGDIRREDIPKTENGPVVNGKINKVHLNQNGHPPNHLIYNKAPISQDSKRDENENKIANDTQNDTKPSVKLTRPVTLHDPTKPVRNGVKSAKIIARKPLSARLPDQQQQKFIKQSDLIRDVMSRNNETSVQNLQPEVEPQQDHAAPEYDNTNFVALNNTNRLTKDNECELTAQNGGQNYTETDVMQQPNSSTRQKSAKARQRAESIEDIPYPVIFEDDPNTDVVNQDDKTDNSTGEGTDGVSYPMVHSDISHDFHNGVASKDFSENDVKSDKMASETSEVPNVVSVYVDGSSYNTPTSALTAPNGNITENSSSEHTVRISHKKTNSIPSIKGILKITSDSTPYGSVSGRRYMAEANGDLNSSTQSLQKDEPKRSSKQVTIQTPEGDKKDKKSKRRVKVKRERPSSAIFFSEEVRKMNKGHPNVIREEPSQVRFGSINGKPARFVSEMSLNNTPYYEMGNPHYIIGDSRKVNKLVTQQAYHSQVPVMYDHVWGRPDMHYQGYQQVSKPNRKFFMHL